jgi:hypothetical protein
VTIRFPRLILFSFSLLIIISSCKKINEATDLGGDIIPGADGVSTFDTTISVESYNSIFDPAKDSVYTGRASDHILGSITSDPFFGKTDATIFLQLKPEFYPWNFSGIYNKDSLQIDSVVMILGWTGTWGDTTIRQHVNVYEMDQTNQFRADSFYLTREKSFTYSSLLGSKDFYPYELHDSIKAFQDTTVGQLRIRLDNSFGRRLLDYDTTQAYKNDSAFSTYVKGFAVVPDASQGNALMRFALASNPNTKLAIYYRYRKGGQDITTVSYFPFTGSSARHNYINRLNNFAGTSLAAASAGPAEDPLIYLINTPGSYATVKIPGLRNLTNRIINRAELIVEQVYDPSDKYLTPPEAVFLDVYDSALSDYKFTPYDFSPNPSESGYDVYGMFGKNTVDGGGNPIRVWKFGITRYVQNILTNKEPLHDFRLISARSVFERYRASVLLNTGGYVYGAVSINSQYAIGRVRVGGGNHPTQRMRLHIIYTKI